MFHKTTMGAFGEGLPCDMNGYVPEAADGPWDLAIDHGTIETHDGDGNLTEYGEWWEEEGFPAMKEEAIEKTGIAVTAAREWATT